MLTTILTLNGWASAWLAAMGTLLWQSTLLVVLAAVVAWLLRRSSPVVRYLAVADRGHQAAADALLDFLRPVAHLGGRQARGAIGNVSANGGPR